MQMLYFLIFKIILKNFLVISGTNQKGATLKKIIFRLAIKDCLNHGSGILQKAKLLDGKFQFPEFTKQY